MSVFSVVVCFGLSGRRAFSSFFRRVCCVVNYVLIFVFLCVVLIGVL